MDYQFAKTTADTFLQELPQYQNQDPYQSKQQFFQRLSNYEEDLQRRLLQQDENVMSETGKMNLFMEHMERQMISQASTNLKYQRLQKDPNLPADSIPNFNFANPQKQIEIDLQKEFKNKGTHFQGNTQKNFWGNGQIMENNKDNQAIMSKEDFYKYHYSMINPENPLYQNGDAAQEDQPNMDKLKENIELLGGIDDCVGAMESTLNGFEIKNLNEKYIHYYTFHNKIQEEQQKKKQAEEEVPINPFFYNPKNLLEKSEFPQKNSNENTQQQFYQSQYQNQQHQNGTQEQFLGEYNQNSAFKQTQQQQQDFSKPQFLENFKQLRNQKQSQLESWQKQKGF